MIFTQMLKSVWIGLVSITVTKSIFFHLAETKLSMLFIRSQLVKLIYLKLLYIGFALK
jgi:hypothetical protein